MLTKVEAHTPRISSTDLLLIDDGPSTDPFQVRNIDGLGPVKAAVNTAPFGSVDGERHLNSWTGKRNIVLTLGLNPNWIDQSMGSLRHAIYKHFMPGQSVTLRFFSDLLPTCQIIGYVESCEPNIFSKDPEMQISVICPEPDFVALVATVVTGVTSSGPFRAPDLVNFSILTYIGTRSTGFTMEISNSVANDEYLAGGITISNYVNLPGEEYSESIAFDATIDSVTQVQFSSKSGDKYIRYTVPGGTISLLDTVYPDEKWPRLVPGANHISVTGTEDAANQSGADLEWSLEYFARFGGL